MEDKIGGSNVVAVKNLSRASIPWRFKVIAIFAMATAASTRLLMPWVGGALDPGATMTGQRGSWGLDDNASNCSRWVLATLPGCIYKANRSAALNTVKTIIII